MLEIDKWEAVRNTIRKNVNSKSDEELLKVPAGLSNNLLWNLGHVVRTMDFLILKLAGEERYFPADLDPYFAKDSSPADWKTTDGLIQKIKEADLACAEKMKTFLKAADPQRKHPEPYQTSMGVTLATIKDSFDYNLIHECIHLGQIQLYNKLI